MSHPPELMIGVDECGWGSIAGPLVVSAAAAVKTKRKKLKCRDSKKYSSRKSMSRDIAHDRKLVRAWQIIVVHPDLLESLGGSRALDYAFQAAVSRLRRRLAPRYPHALLDGNDGHKVPYSHAMPKADDKNKLVGFASCIGKMHQNQMLYRAGQLWPEYGFDTNSGYGTQPHITAIREHGAVPGWHRMRRCNNALNKFGESVVTRETDETFSIPKEIHS